MTTQSLAPFVATPYTTIYAASEAVGMADPAWKKQFDALEAYGVLLARSEGEPSGNISPHNRGWLNAILRQEMIENNLKYYPAGDGRGPPLAPRGFDSGTPFTWGNIATTVALAGLAPNYDPGLLNSGVNYVTAIDPLLMPPGMAWTLLDQLVQSGGSPSLADQGITRALVGASVNDNGVFVIPSPGISPAGVLDYLVGTPSTDKTFLEKHGGQLVLAAIATIGSAAIAQAITAGSFSGVPAPEVPAAPISPYIAAPAAPSTIPQYIALGTAPAATPLENALALDASSFGIAGGTGVTFNTGSLFDSAVNFSKASAVKIGGEAATIAGKTVTSVATTKLIQHVLPQPKSPLTSSDFFSAPPPPSAPGPSPATDFLSQFFAWLEALVHYVEDLFSSPHAHA